MRPIEQTTALVTGATDGIGRGVAKRLAQLGATVLLHGRSRARLDETLADLHESTGNERLRAVRADFSSLPEVSALVDEVLRTTDALHVLVNNAGIAIGLPDGRRDERRESSDGYELRFAVNYLAGFALTQGLLPLLRRSAPARIVFVAAGWQVPIDFDDPQITRDYDGGRAYAQSKLAQVTYAMALAERLPADEVTVTSLHPGSLMPTKIVLEEFDTTEDTIEDGIESVIHAAVAPELEGVTGEFFLRLDPARADEHAYDPETRRRLWELSERLVAGAHRL
ncbi:MAG TPA: SDR family NAD(P)-dependent oxidoreductase [Conexibacter sp.]|jgi:NAD(P)-dependent dehydrogenase (short-subunit alcohol dehydrogenase family)